MKFATLGETTRIPEPTPLPDFTLVDHRGAPYTRDNLRGDWQLVFFGFTHCPDICPATLQQLSIARQRVVESGKAFPGIVLISVDPERDTPAAMAEYVAHFGDDVTGVTGSTDQLRALTGPLGIYFAKHGDPSGNYSVDHSSVVLLIDEDASWQAVFSAPHDVEVFAHDVPILTGG